MKKTFQIFLLIAFSAAIFNCADAQRTRESRQSPSRSESRSYSAPTRQYSTRSAPVRTFESRPAETRRNETVMRTTPSGNITMRTTPQRNTTVINSQREVVSRNSYSRQTPVMRNNYNYGSYHYNNYGYSNHYYGNVYGRRTFFMYGPRYRVIPHSFISIRFGGYPYYYNNGFYYGYYGGYYQPIFPPFGLQISVLPYGYSRIFIGPVPYYYYNGIYYRQYDDSYQVVDAPMGATVTSLPGGARSVVINGENLYELNGTYYKADTDSNGNNVFIVVGKNGVINNTNGDETGITNSPSSLQIGDIINQLPQGSKIVTLNGEQVYQTPDNIYLEQESNNGVVQYKVIGK
jgi:hypothetical protein